MESEWELECVWRCLGISGTPKTARKALASFLVQQVHRGIFIDGWI